MGFSKQYTAVPTSWGSSQPRDWTCIFYISCTGRRALYHYLCLSSYFIYLLWFIVIFGYVDECFKNKIWKVFSYSFFKYFFLCVSLFPFFFLLPVQIYFWANLVHFSFWLSYSSTPELLLGLFFLKKSDCFFIDILYLVTHYYNVLVAQSCPTLWPHGV